MNKYAIILAAGKGTRMKSKHDDISKVSFEILGKPLVKWVIDSLKPIGFDEIVTVVGFGGENAKKIVENDSEVVWQKEQKGTGHAVMQAAKLLENKDGLTIVCCGDTPLLKEETFKGLLEEHEASCNDLTIMTSILDDPFGYGRIVKKGQKVVKIVEQKDANDEEKAIKEVNAGVYVFDNKELFKSLGKINSNNAAGEYYLTDVISIFVKNGKKVGTCPVDFAETLGVNDRVQLSIAGEILKQRINRRHMLNGVTIIDPNNTYIGPDVTIGQDTTIYPNTIILGNKQIPCDSVVGPNEFIK